MKYLNSIKIIIVYLIYLPALTIAIYLGWVLVRCADFR